MLIEFTVGNYLSFKEKVTFSMVATDLGTQTRSDKNNVFHVDDELSLLKSAAVYGANASGKSNLVKAFNFVCQFIINSSRNQIIDLIDVQPFKLQIENISEPSLFEVMFCLNKRIYRYGFKVRRKEIIEEWLFHTPSLQERQLFYRINNSFKLNRQSFKEGIDLGDKTRKNALFLSVVAQFNGKVSQNILLWFSRLEIVSGINSEIYKSHTIVLLKDDKFNLDLLTFINKMDLGIDSIHIEEYDFSEDNFVQSLSENARQELIKDAIEKGIISLDIRTIHKQYDADGDIVSMKEFDLDEDESEGTKKLFGLIGLVWKVLQNGNVLVIDELDARFHPFITKSIVELFNSQDTNPNNAQLIFMTHDTNLLSKNLFRKDQIWFVEKNKYGATDLYSLVEYDIPDDAEFESDYIKGKYGAIPYIGVLTDLFANSHS